MKQTQELTNSHFSLIIPAESGGVSNTLNCFEIFFHITKFTLKLGSCKLNFRGFLKSLLNPVPRFGCDTIVTLQHFLLFGFNQTINQNLGQLIIPPSKRSFFDSVSHRMCDPAKNRLESVALNIQWWKFPVETWRNGAGWKFKMIVIQPTGEKRSWLEIRWRQLFPANSIGFAGGEKALSSNTSTSTRVFRTKWSKLRGHSYSRSWIALTTLCFSIWFVRGTEWMKSVMFSW